MNDDEIVSLVMKHGSHSGRRTKPQGDLSAYTVENLYALYLAHHFDAPPVRLHGKAIDALRREGLCVGKKNDAVITPKGIAFMRGVWWGLGLTRQEVGDLATAAVARQEVADGTART